MSRFSLIRSLAFCTAAFFVVGTGIFFNPVESKLWAQETNNSKGAQIREATPAEDVFTRCETWIKKNGTTEQFTQWEQQAKQQQASLETLDFVLFTLSQVKPEVKKLSNELPTMPRFAIIQTLEKFQVQIDEAWLEANLHFWIAKQLSQRELYEEALQEFVQIKPELVVDPAAYFFHRAICEHHLLLQKEGLASLETLLTECKPLASRHRMIGELLKQDLAKLKPKGLDEISRKMTDVERRLNIGRAGKKVQKIEREIVESLDELIKKLEEQAGGGGGAGSGSGNGNQPNSAAKESSVKGSTAPGEVDEKKIGRKDGWGDLPPKEQAKAKQILGTLFPPHYRRAIEAYNRKAAQRDSSTP